MNTTLYLDPRSWDLTLDAAGNIAMASEPYSLAQDVASAIRTFLGECYYDTTLGIDYFRDILAAPPPLELYRAKCIAAALAVPGVADAKVFFTGIDNRKLIGQAQITSTSGQVSAIGI